MPNRIDVGGQSPNVGVRLNRVFYLSALDQLIVSGSMFALNLAFIGFATPDAFGRFILVFALSMLSFGAQNAVILTPLNVLLATASGQRRRLTLRMLSTLDSAVLALTSAVVVGLSALLGLPLLLCGLGGLLAFTNGMREFHRYLYLTNSEPLGLLSLNITAFSCALAVTLGLSFARPLEEAALLGLIVGNLAGVALFRQPTFSALRRLPRMMRRYAPYWRKSRWALFGAGITDAHLRLYVFAIELARGSTALGIIHAGRVLVNPVAMLAFAWGRAMRPVLAKQIADGDKRAALHTLIEGVAGLTAIGAVYALLLNAAAPFLQNFIGGTGNLAFLEYLPLWGLFAVLGVPSICISVYLQAAHRYRTLAMSMLGSVLISIAALGALFFDAPLDWAIYSLIAGELALLAILVAVCLPEALGMREARA